MVAADAYEARAVRAAVSVTLISVFISTYLGMSIFRKPRTTQTAAAFSKLKVQHIAWNYIKSTPNQKKKGPATAVKAKKMS